MQHAEHKGKLASIFLKHCAMMTEYFWIIQQLLHHVTCDDVACLVT